MRSRIIFAIIILFVAVAAIRFFYSRNGEPQSTDSQLSPEPLASPMPVFEEAILNDVAGGLSVGLAKKSIIGAEFFVSVTAQLDSPHKDFFYEAWMVRGIGKEIETLSLGKMERSGEAKIWNAVFRTSSPPPSDYREVWVTVEQKEDDSPERLILKGTF